MWKSLKDAVVHSKGGNESNRVDQTWRLATCVGWRAVPHDVLWRLHISGRISVNQAESGAAESALRTLETCSTQQSAVSLLVNWQSVLNACRWVPPLTCADLQLFQPSVTFNRGCFRGGHLLFRRPVESFSVTKFGDSSPQLTKLASSGLRHGRPQQNFRP